MSTFLFKKGSKRLGTKDSYIAELEEGDTVEEALEELRELIQDEGYGEHYGSWFATVDWYEDPRSKEGEPFQTVAATGGQPFKSVRDGDPLDLFETIEDRGDDFLPFRPRGKSGATGPAVINSIGWIILRKPRKHRR